MHARAYSSPPRLRIVVTPPPAECAKCGFVRGNARACARCGLASEKVSQFLSREAACVPAELLRTWEIAVATWHCPEAHDALLELARKHDQYAWLARSYRTRLREGNGDQLAERQLARVARAAELSLALARVPREAPQRMPYRGVLWIVVAIVVALASAGLYARAQASANPASRASDSPILVSPR